MRIEGIKTHTVKHMWEAYAKELLAKNPDYVGKYFNKIHNFYIFKKGTKTRTVITKYSGYQTSDKAYSMSGLVISYTEFRKIIADYFEKAKREIIKGNAININGVGKICVKRVERDFRKDRQRFINWAATKNQPKIWDEQLGRERYTKYIYFTTDDWCRIAWFKHTQLTNKTVYEFEPSNQSSSGVGGFKSEFSKALQSDKLLKYQYLYQQIFVQKIPES